MEKTDHTNKQTNLFAQDPQWMHWDELPEEEQRQTRSLLPQLVLSLFYQLSQLQNRQEDYHAAENNF